MIARLCSDFKGFLQGVTCSPKELKHNIYLMKERERKREREEGEGGRETTYWVHQSPPEPNPNGMLSDQVVLKEDWSLIIMVVANHGSLL